MTQSRQLAAIMFTDIVGYTALMGEDEQQAFELLKKNRQVQRPIIEKFGGRWLKEMGDGVLASFPTVTDAVYCAATIQKACENEPDLNLRIGIHQGEVVFEGDDVFGDGVNIASRLEPLAPVGGIMVSESVHINVLNKKGIDSEFVKEQKLKNVKQPIKIYQVKVTKYIPKPKPSPAVVTPNQIEPSVPKPSYQKKVLGAAVVILLLLVAYLIYSNSSSKEPAIESADQTEILDRSIAVLPFNDISPDGDQQWFSDGVTSAILNHLTLIEALKVKSKTSVMPYRGSNKTVPEIAQELGVSYILEGEIQLYNDSIRIVVQLIDAKSDTHIWADNYDHPFTGIFSIQSDIAKKVAEVLKAEISSETTAEIEQRPTNSPEAYALYLKGHETNSMDYLDQAIALDSNYADAYAAKGMIWLLSGAIAGSEKPQVRISNALPLVNKALEIEPDHNLAHTTLGAMQLWYFWNFKEAEKEYLAAIRADPTELWTIVNYMQLLRATGRFQESLDWYQQATTEGHVQDPGGLATCRYFAGQLEEAEKLADAQVVQKTDFPFWPYFVLYVHLGRYQSALDQLKKALSVFGPESLIPVGMAYGAIIYFKLGNFDKTQEMRKMLLKKSKESPVGSPAFYLAMVNAQTGEIDSAFRWLERAYQDHEVEMYWLKVEPLFEPLLSDPRWQVMLDKVGFPE